MIRKLRTALSILLVATATNVTIPVAAEAANTACVLNKDYTSSDDGTFITLSFSNTSATCDWTVPSNVTRAEIAIVAGGGSGGGNAQPGGGGAGQVLYNSSFGVSAGTAYAVKVGAGAVGVIGNNMGNSGGDSTFGSFVAVGGGGGGSSNSFNSSMWNGSSGGSSGGSSRNGRAPRDTSGNTYPEWTSYGNKGGSGSGFDSTSNGGAGGGTDSGATSISATGGGGGGGGAYSLGESSTTVISGTSATVKGGAGGSAIYLMGTCLAGGGSGAAQKSNYYTGGSISGGTAAKCFTPSGNEVTGIVTGGTLGAAGAANTGSGGGGNTLSSGTGNGGGAAGVVIVKYSTALPNQTITFASITDKTFNTPSFRAAATTTASGLTVTVTSANTSICTYSGETVTLVSTGTCTLTASQAGSASVQAAANVVRSFLISKGTPTLGSFTSVTKTYGDSSFALDTVTSSVSGSFQFTSLNTSVISTFGSTASIVGAGTASIQLLFNPNDTVRWETRTVTGTVTVSKRNLNITAPNLSVQFGSARSTFSSSLLPTYSGFVGSETQSVLNTLATCSETPTYTTSSSVALSPYAINCSGAASNNYSFTYLPGALTVSKSGRTISFATTTVSKTYGDSTFSVPATPSLGAGDGTISYTNTGSACSVTSSGTVTILAAGTCSISASITAGTSYEAASTSIPVSITVAAKTLSISGSRIASKVYDGNRTPGSLTVGTLSGMLSGESLTVTGILSQLSSANADTYTVNTTYTLINGTGGLASNYTLASESLQAVVTKKTLTVTATSPTVAYGDNVPSISFTYSGFVGSENATYMSQAPTCSTAYTNTSNYGSSPATSCSGASASNYIIQYVSGSVTINRVNLTVTASSHSVSYGDAIPNFTFTISGFKNSESAAVLTTQPTCSTTNYSNSSPTGTYYSRCSGAAATNYTFSYVDGVITANSVSRSVTLSVGSSTLVYGDSTPATFSMSGNQSDGSIALTVQSGSCQVIGSSVKALAGTGSCVIRATASGAISYSDTYTALTIVLSKKALSISGTTIASRAYNGTVTRGTVTRGTVTGYVGSDSLNVSADALDYSSANVGTYSTTVQYTLISTAQGVSSNYSLASQSVSGQITPVALTVTAPSFSRLFSQAAPTSLTPTITGFVNSEGVSALTTTPTCTTTYTTSSTVGSAQSTSCSGAVATNYTFNYVSGVVTVTPLVRVIDISSNKTSLVYGESASINVSVSIGANDGTLSVTASGSGCSISADNSTVTAIDPNGTCTIGASITGGTNYNDTTATPLIITLTKKNLTITGVRTSSKVYDGSLVAPLSGGSLVGVVNSDSITVTVAGRFSDKLVGRNKPVTSISTISGAAASKYTLTQPTLTNETITAASVTVSGLSAKTRPANGTKIATIEGTPILSGIVSGDSVTLANYNQGTFDTSTVGESITVTVAMSLSGTDSNNYTLTIPTFRASITIAYDNTITFGTLPDIAIGSSQFTLVASTTSGLPISFSASGGACSLSGETISLIALGSCSITASQSGNTATGGTVPAATSITRTFNVTTRALTITADDKTYIAGGSATPTYKISGGLIAGDRINAVTIRYSGGGLSNSVSAPSTAGTFSIVISGAVFNNSSRANLYSITYINGALVVFDTTPKELTNLRVLASGGSTTDLLGGAYSNSTSSYSLRVDYAISSVLITMARANSTNVNVQARVNESGWRTLKWSNIVGGTTDSGVLPLPAATNTISLRLYGSDKELDSQSRIITILIYRDQASRPVANPADTASVVSTFTDRINETPLPAAAAVSAISFTPTVDFGLFSPNQDSYTATVAKRISAISINTSFTGSGTTVKVSVNNGPQKVIPASGKSETYALNIGSNSVNVRVNSPDGSLQQYLFTITRAAS